MHDLSVIVDKRERNGELIDGLGEAGVEVSFEILPVGDYAISDRVCIERKTMQDFEGSIISGRLFDQLERLRSGYECPVILIEGDIEGLRLSKSAVRGAIAAICIDYGIAVVFSSNPKDSAEMIAHLARHEQGGGERSPSVKGGLRAHSDRQFQEYVVGNLPGVGPKTARALLEHFGSVAGIANADACSLMDVDGVGRKRAEAIARVLKGRYDAGSTANNYMRDLKK